MRGRLVAAALAASGAFAGGCSDPCCLFDSRPITLEHGPQGELMAQVTVDGAPAQRALVDTGTPITIWNTPLGSSLPEVRAREIRILGAGAGALPTRAVFRGITTVAGPLSPLSLEAGAGSAPALLMGGDLLGNFSLEIGFGAPQLVLWQEQRATDSFLSAAGYAVLRVNRRGGGEIESLAPRDGIGPRGPYQYPSSLLVLRGCGGPIAFDREAAPPSRCCAGEERTLASGADLALLLGTGYGPVILSRSAWNRITRQLPVPPPAGTPGMLLVATAAAPIAAEMTTLPRLALVDREADSSLDPGPCVELGRSRRLEQVAVRQARNAEQAPCALLCDQDPRTDQRAQNSAGYLELTGNLPVAIIGDGENLLQTLRAEIRPEGPEIDGIIGAGALQNARVELDYRNQPARAIFSCEAAAPAGACRAVGRCPRLPEPGQTHSCFGLPPHALPRMCDNQVACE